MFTEVLVKKQENGKQPETAITGWSIREREHSGYTFSLEKTKLWHEKNVQKAEVEKSGIHNNAIWMLWYGIDPYLETKAWRKIHQSALVARWESYDVSDHLNSSFYTFQYFQKLCVHLPFENALDIPSD